jgi:D-xylose 1-dehydrogenase (NADP+, D-xylono-1,5-lactone-forming)
MTRASKKFRWGVLGCARIALKEVIPAIQRSTNGVVHAIGSRDPAKLKDAMGAFGIPRGHLGYEKVIADPEVDGIYIPLPNSQHCEWTLAAAKAGKPVLCEKPIGLSADECRTMTAACARAGVVLMEAFMYRYTDRLRQVASVIDSGALGEIRQVNASFRFLLANPSSIKLQPALGGGSLYDVGCYPVNFVGWVADRIAGTTGAERPESVAVTADVVNGIDMNLAAVLRYRSGMLANLQCGFNAHKRVFSEIIGTQGLLEIPDTFFGNPGAITLTTDQGTRAIEVAESDRYRLEVEDFAQAVWEQRPPLFPLSESLRNMEVIDRLRLGLQQP